MVIKAEQSLLSDERLKRIVNAILEVYSPERIICFGSRTQAERDEESDFDILVVLKTTDTPFYQRSTPVRMKLRQLGVPLDLLILQESEIDSEHPFFQEILSTGIQLYERKAG